MSFAFLVAGLACSVIGHEVHSHGIHGLDSLWAVLVGLSLGGVMLTFSLGVATIIVARLEDTLRLARTPDRVDGGIRGLWSAWRYSRLLRRRRHWRYFVISFAFLVVGFAGAVTGGEAYSHHVRWLNGPMAVLVGLSLGGVIAAFSLGVAAIIGDRFEDASISAGMPGGSDRAGLSRRIAAHAVSRARTRRRPRRLM
jgi:hypothetical protein